jgi:purine nucleosidase
MTRKIIIDTDPGQDDAAALMLAFGSQEELEILALCAVAGNVALDLTSKNIRKICELCGQSDIPVYEGATKPLVRKPVTAEHVHGQTGLDGPDLPEPKMQVQPLHAVDYIIETIRREPEGTITICTLGSMTNVALALQKAPDIATRIQEVVMMGGGFSEGGNITPAAEFNVFVDPHAADIVLRSGAKLTMLPLDITHQLLATRAHLDRIKAISTAPALAMVDMLEFSERFDIAKFGSDGAPLHDPSVIGYLVKPELFAGRLCNVSVETQSQLTMGMTVVDWWHVTERPKNVQFLRTVDVEGFFDLFIGRLARI